MSATYNFAGKVALITGSSSGIGAATAILFAKSGANVVITGRNADNVQKVAKQCQSVSPKGLKPLQVVAEVTKEADLDRLLAATIQTFGKLDILVNNAGGGSMRAITDPDFFSNHKQIFETNVNSVLYLTQISLKYLEKTKGNVVNISSIAACITMKHFTSYCMSKVALDMFTRCMAAELGPKRIRVNSVNPGIIRTNYAQHNFGMKNNNEQDALWDKLTEPYPVGRAGVANDIAHAVAYLASDHAQFLTGTILLADGGHIAANVNVVL